MRVSKQAVDADVRCVAYGLQDVVAFHQCSKEVRAGWMDEAILNQLLWPSGYKLVSTARCGAGQLPTGLRKVAQTWPCGLAR
jgi:hypothetical protein